MSGRFEAGQSTPELAWQQHCVRDVGVIHMQKLPCSMGSCARQYYLPLQRHSTPAARTLLKPFLLALVQRSPRTQFSSAELCAPTWTPTTATQTTSYGRRSGTSRSRWAELVICMYNMICTELCRLENEYLQQGLKCSVTLRSVCALQGSSGIRDVVSLVRLDNPGFPHSGT